MNCKKSMATFLALAVAANATGVPVRAEDKSFLERIEALENANWTMTPWRNVLNGLGDLPDDIDKLDEFLLQDKYFDGNLTLAEKIFNAPREKFANYKGYNALNAKRVFGGKLNRYNLTNTCKLATTSEEISNEQEAYDAMLLEHRFDDRSGDVCMSDEAVRAYQQQVNELLEGSWLDLVNGTDLMLHMKDGRVFNCADLLPDGLCRDLILTFTEEGREAAEKMLRTGIFALGATAVLFFVWKLSSNKGVADSNKDNDDNSGPGGGSGPGTGGSDDFKDLSFEKKKYELKRLLLSVQNEICALRTAEEGENATALQLKLDVIIGNNPTVGSFMSRSDAVTAQNIDELLQRAKTLANEVQKNKEEEEERKKKEQEEKARKEGEERKKKEQELEIAKQKGQEKLNTLTTAINAAGDKGGKALTDANELKTELTNEINAPNATAEAINAAAAKVDGVVEALNAAVEEAKEQEEKEKREREEERLKQEQQALEAAQTECKQAIEALEAEIGKAKRSNVSQVTIKEAESLVNTSTALLNNNDVSAIKGQIQKLETKTKALKQIVADAERAEEEKKRKAEEERQALEIAKQQGGGKLTELNNAIDAAGDKGGDKLTAANELKTELTNALNGVDANAINTAANKVDDAVKALNKAVKEAKEQEEKARKEEEERKRKEAEEAARKKAEEERKKKEQEEKARKEEEERKRKEEEERQALETAKQKGQEKLNTLTTAINAAGDKGGKALTDANELKTELTNEINAPNATAEAINAAAAKVDGVVEELNAAVEKARNEEKARKKKEEDERKKKEDEEIRAREQQVLSKMSEDKKNLEYWDEHQNDYLGFIKNNLKNNQQKNAKARLQAVNKALELARQNKGNAEAIQLQIDIVQQKINGQLESEESLNMMGFNANEGSPLLQYFLAVKAELENLKTKPKFNTNVASFVRNWKPKEIKEIKEVKEQAEEKKEDVIEVEEMKEEKPAEKKDVIKSVQLSDSIDAYVFEQFRKQRDWQVMVRPENNLRQQLFERNQQQTVQKKDERHLQEEIEQIEQVAQMVNLEQPPVEIPLDTAGRVKAAQAALQAAQGDPENKPLIEEKLELVNRLIQEYRQWLQRQAISNDKILEKLRSIYAQLEEMLNELEEQPKEEKEEPKKDDDDNNGDQGGADGDAGNGMKEDEKKEEKDDENGNSNSNGDGQPQQNDAANAQQDPENHENHSRVDLAYLANVAKHIPECLFTKENLGAAAGVGVAAATSGIPAAIPAAGAAAIGYNTLKCADEKATMELYHKQSLKNLQESLDRRSIWDRLSPATSEQSDAELMNDLSKKFDEEKRLAANRGDMATLYGYDQNDLNNQVGTHVAMAAPARM